MWWVRKDSVYLIPNNYKVGSTNVSDKKLKSSTKLVTNLGERLFNWSPHFETTISDGKKRVKCQANDADEAQKRAAKKWVGLRKNE